MNIVSWWKARWIFVVMGGISLLFLGLYYWSFRHFAYPAAPGGDLVNHYGLMEGLKREGFGVFLKEYPRFFHLLMWCLTTITGGSFLKVALYLVPIVLLAVAYAYAWTASRMGGKVAGLAAFLLALLAAGQPLQTLYDGGFPNTLAAHVFLPLFCGALYQYLVTRKRRWTGLSALFAGLVVSTHGFTLVILLLVLFSLPFYYPSFIKRYGLWVLPLFLLFMVSPLGESGRIMIHRFLVLTDSFPWFHLVGSLDNPNAIWKLRDYPIGIGQSIVYPGIVGLLYLGWRAFKDSNRNPLAYILLMWAIILFAGSRMEALSFPVRLARDLAAPLLISAAILFAALWNKGNTFLKLGIATMYILLAYPMVHDRFQRLLVYEPTMQYSTANQKSLEYIGADQAAMLDQNLPALVKGNAAPYVLHKNEEGDFVQPERSLDEMKYAVYEVRPEADGVVYRPYLEEQGFREVAAFYDPLKKVVVMKRL